MRFFFFFKNVAAKDVNDSKKSTRIFPFWPEKRIEYYHKGMHTRENWSKNRRITLLSSKSSWKSILKWSVKRSPPKSPSFRNFVREVWPAHWKTWMLPAKRQNWMMRPNLECWEMQWWDMWIWLCVFFWELQAISSRSRVRLETTYYICGQESIGRAYMVNGKEHGKPSHATTIASRLERNVPLV